MFPVEEMIIDKFGDTLVTPIMVSAKLHHEHCLIAWLKRDVDVTCRNTQRKTVLTLVVEAGLTHALKHLLLKQSETFVDSRDWYGNSALFYATEKDCINILKEAGANLNAVNRIGYTPLLCAIERGSVGTVKALLYAGANVNKTNYDGFTPLMLSVGQRESKIMNMLLAFGADLDATRIYKETALSYAASEGFLGSVKLLLQAGSYVNVSNQELISANLSMHAYRCADYAACIMLLYVAGQDIKDANHCSAPKMLQNDSHTILLGKGDHVLKYFCRKTIRKHLLSINNNTNLFQQVNKIHLPSPLKSYLLYDMSLN